MEKLAVQGILDREHLPITVLMPWDFPSQGTLHLGALYTCTS